MPLLVRWPGRTPAGTVSDHPWAAWDLLPTLAELAGVPPPPGIDGASRLGLLLGRPAPDPAPLYWEFHEGGFSQAVRLGRWKAVRRKSVRAPILLFDLHADPGERHDVAAGHPDVVRRIRRLLKTSRTPDRRWPVR